MANQRDTDEASSSDIQSVARVGQICALFGPDTDELTAAEVAERLGLNRTTAYRYCVSLVAAGILERSSRRGAFALGGVMLQLGIHALARRRVITVAPRHLAALSGSVRLTAVVSIWGARGPVVALVEEDRSRTMVVTVREGTQLDHTAAQTHVFLAHMTDRERADYLAESASPGQRAEYEAATTQARSDGFAVVYSSGGLFAVAAPVLDATGIAATVAVMGVGPEVDLGATSPIVTSLVATADAIGADLGAHVEESAPSA
ncbi:IclR family transcriptional regulator [Agrococcus versicolor]